MIIASSRFLATCAHKDVYYFFLPNLIILWEYEIFLQVEVSNNMNNSNTFEITAPIFYTEVIANPIWLLCYVILLGITSVLFVPLVRTRHWIRSCIFAYLLLFCIGM